MLTLTRRDALVAVLKVEAKSLDADNAPRFRALLQELLGDLGGVVVLDFEDVSFVDSSGLGALVTAFRRFHQAGGDLKVCGLSRPVRLIFELVRLHKVFEVYPDVALAVKSTEFGCPEEAGL